MNQEVKTCQNCKKQFIIEPDDFSFYETIKVPAPTWCPQCRLFRRMAWQGYRILYKRPCDFTGEQVISTHHPDSPHTIYRQDIWWSDQWDPKSYGREYDFSKSFFEQFRSLFLEVPLPNLHTDYVSMVNSDYCNGASGVKNGYLCFRITKGEDCGYLNVVVNIKNSYDLSFSNSCESSYECLTTNHCNKAFYSRDCENCHDVWFSQDLVGCSNCVGCINLRNKSYHIFNKPYSKEAYEEKLKEFDFGSQKFVKNFSQEVKQFFLTQPRRNFRGIKNEDVRGDYIFNSKNVKDSYMVRNAQNLRYCAFLKDGPAANSYDWSVFGDGGEWIYDSVWTGWNTSNVKFCIWAYKNENIEYCFGCHSSRNLFGCVGIRSGEYCILNKQYSKNEYEALLPKIRQQMEEMPYQDSVGRTFKYGEYFPPEHCPWTYNESAGYDLFPLSKEEAIKAGFLWREDDGREYKDATMVVPDNIRDVDDEILKAILKCEQCRKNYLIIRQELDFYRQFGLSVPRNCSLCRERNRTALLNPPFVYDRTCAKCNKAIQTSYPLESPYIVYCEQCYQAEVV